MPLHAGSAWTSPETVAGFVTSPPNPVLLEYARRVQERLATGGRLLDLGCGAGRNAAPLAKTGWAVIGVDLSWPMLQAARARQTDGRLDLIQAPMDALPIRSQSVDFIVAHGVWNLAASGREFRQGVAEAARVARKGASLFLFTFSRTTLPASARPLAGESFVFTEFSGTPQCFLTEREIVAELGAAGFEPDADLPLCEINRPRPGMLPGSGPVIHQGGFSAR